MSRICDGTYELPTTLLGQNNSTTRRGKAQKARESPYLQLSHLPFLLCNITLRWPFLIAWGQRSLSIFLPVRICTLEMEARRNMTAPAISNSGGGIAQSRVDSRI